MAHEERDGRAEGGDLRQRQVDEDDVALEHLQAEVGVDADERDARDRGQQQEGGGFRHRSARASVRTS